jgi:diadenosine tetraphosphate (Ap4A) HIT family hydrolase
MAYDDQNIFAKIIRGEIPCNKVTETEHCLAFHDINPQTPTHILVIPKGPYEDLDAFSANASEAEIVDYIRTLGAVARQAGVAADGYRTLTNNGRDAHQEVPHLHFHIFAGKNLGRMIKPIDK